MIFLICFCIANRPHFLNSSFLVHGPSKIRIEYRVHRQGYLSEKGCFVELEKLFINIFRQKIPHLNVSLDPAVMTTDDFKLSAGHLHRSLTSVIQLLT
ncbi:hypothetical protein TNCT_165981 [Trichonephila clavata]|uniref:Uncharacterized protein n=1 Tax=Trichonephila clavata TaxID=2740835 RepID=A0A8X6IAG6_TRICU|nr:hypothetical protein TNCT_165981 [Trichonephila clavata]